MQGLVLETEGRDKSGPCLIAGFHALTDSHPDYYNPIFEPGGEVASVDMVRLNLSFISDKGVWINDHGETVDADEVSCWTSKIRPGGWHDLWNYKMGSSSVSLGIGFMEPSCRVNMHRGFLEFNPNKVAGDRRFEKLLDRLRPCVSRATLSRFDLAYDVPISRDNVRVTKDRRMYEAIISGGITEYLGRKNTPGYVKVYDKKAEAGLSTDMTRIELTCAGDWTADHVGAHWPQVHGWTVPDDTRDWVRVVGILLAEKAERGEEVETLVSMLGRGSRPKVREFLRTPTVEMCEGTADMVIQEALSWCAKTERGI